MLLKRFPATAFSDHLVDLFNAVKDLSEHAKTQTFFGYVRQSNQALTHDEFNTFSVPTKECLAPIIRTTFPDVQWNNTLLCSNMALSPKQIETIKQEVEKTDLSQEIKDEARQSLGYIPIEDHLFIPFKLNVKLPDETTIEHATTRCVEWFKECRFPDDKIKPSKIKDCMVFAALSSVKFNIPDDFDAMALERLTGVEKLETFLRDYTEPISEESLFQIGVFFAYIYAHDDCGLKLNEEQANCFNLLLITLLDDEGHDKSEDVSAVEEFNTAWAVVDPNNTHTDIKKHCFPFAAATITVRDMCFKQFSSLCASANPSETIGFNDFKADLTRYFLSSIYENEHKSTWDLRTFLCNRTDTSGVKLCLLMAVLGTETPINNIRDHDDVKRLELGCNLFTSIINGWFSAYKERSTDWSSNDIPIVKTQYEHDSLSPEKITDKHPIKHMGEELQMFLLDMEKTINAALNSSQSLPSLDTHTPYRERLPYFAINLQWLMGGLLAEGFLKRYKSPDQPFIPDDTGLKNIDASFEFLGKTHILITLKQIKKSVEDAAAFEKKETISEKINQLINTFETNSYDPNTQQELEALQKHIRTHLPECKETENLALNCNQRLFVLKERVRTFKTKWNLSLTDSTQQEPSMIDLKVIIQDIFSIENIWPEAFDSIKSVKLNLFTDINPYMRYLTAEGRATAMTQKLKVQFPGKSDSQILEELHTNPDEILTYVIAMRENHFMVPFLVSRLTEQTAVITKELSLEALFQFSDDAPTREKVRMAGKVSTDSRQ